MRLVTLVVAAMVASGGCTHYRAVRAGGASLAGVGAATALLAGAACLPYAFPAPQDEDPNKNANLRGCRNLALVGALMFAIGLPLFIYGQGGVTQERREEQMANARRSEELEERFRVSREHAWASTQEAANAARAGDCGTVLVRARFVYNLDREFYATVFVRDAGIKRCLPTPPPPRDPIKDREQAFALLKTATSAARAGNCAAVLEVEGKIRDLDANVHGAWFVHDDAIKACLASPPETHTPPDAPTLEVP